MTEPVTLYDRFMGFSDNISTLGHRRRVLLAVSGGMDSMAMLHLFHRSPYHCGIAHCNFQLRGAAADQDQQLVESTAKTMGIPCFTMSFNTSDYARREKISVQMAARALRYGWLEKIRAENGFDFIATAHHLDDSIETLLINLVRGTGIAGFKGIPYKTGNVIRPLLFAARKEIRDFVETNQVPYREDLSNEDEKYIRNKIRLQIVPGLKEINPSLETTLDAFFQHMTDTEKINQWAIEMAKTKCVSYGRDQVRICLDSLRQIPGYGAFLFMFLRDFKFTPDVAKSLAKNPERQAGKVFHSTTHTLLTGRKELLLFPVRSETVQKPEIIPGPINDKEGQCRFGNYIFNYDSFHISGLSQTEWPENEYTALLDLDRLHFPLTLRCWKKGDRMKPLGMSGSKKISDIFTDYKIPVHKKSEIPMLVSEAEIAWICGLRTSETFKIRPSTKTIFRIKAFIINEPNQV